MKNTVWGIVILMLFVFTEGCAPVSVELDLPQRNAELQPQEYESRFKERCNTLHKAINTGLGKPLYVIPLPWKKEQEKSLAEILLGDLSEMLESSLNRLSGDFLRVIADDREYDRIFKRYDNKTPVPRPGIAVEVSLIAFDRNIKQWDTDCELGVYIPAVIEGEEVDTDIRLECEKAESISRVVLDLRLMDFNTHTFYPKMQVTNTILVFNIEKERNWGFMIYGSGFSRSERIEINQGLQQAVNTLIDYSILELFSMFYNVPFWQTEALPDKEQKWLAEWHQDFLSLGDGESGLQRQVYQIQNWLTKYDMLTPVYVNNALHSQIPEAEYGSLGLVTQAFILRFLHQYAPQSSLIADIEQKRLSQKDLATLYVLLIQNIPLYEEQSKQMTTHSIATTNPFNTAQVKKAVQVSDWASFEESMFSTVDNTVQHVTQNAHMDMTSCRQEIALLAAMFSTYRQQQSYPSLEVYEALNVILQTTQRLANSQNDINSSLQKQVDIAFLQQALYAYEFKLQKDPDAQYPTRASTIAKRLQQSSGRDFQPEHLQKMVDNYATLIQTNSSVAALSIFEHNSAEINPSAHPLLDEYGQALKHGLQDFIFLIAAHADSLGSEQYNQRLSNDRAQAIKNFLVSNYGIEPTRLVTVGYSESYPMASNKTEQGKAINRRVEFINLGRIPSQEASSGTTVANAVTH